MARSYHSERDGRKIWSDIAQSTQTRQSGYRDDWAMIGVCSRSPSTAMLFEPRRNFGSDPCAPFRKNGLEGRKPRLRVRASVSFQTSASLSPPKGAGSIEGLSVKAGDDFLDSKITSLVVGARNTICCRSVLLRKHSCTPYMHSPYIVDARVNVALTAMVRFQRRAL
jgi:hypothetical protein